jgi:SAM-dependent methyltransferase
MASQNQDRLRSHFASLDPSSHASGWDSLWAEGTFIPWDRGYANPALIDFLASPSNPPTSSDPNPTPGAPKPNTIDGEGVRLPKVLKEDGSRRRALVPGCGKGYDVALLASWGYDAYGLEVSAHAAEAANKYLAEPGEGPLEGEYKVKDEKVESGAMKCLLGDFFEDGWIKEAGGQGGFDVIYDNTVSFRTLHQGVVELDADMCSSYVLYHPLCVQNGLHGWPPSSRLTVFSSVSSSQRTSLPPRAVHRGRYHQLYTKNY